MALAQVLRRFLPARPHHPIGPQHSPIVSHRLSASARGQPQCLSPGDERWTCGAEPDGDGSPASLLSKKGPGLNQFRTFAALTGRNRLKPGVISASAGTVACRFCRAGCAVQAAEAVAIALQGALELGKRLGGAIELKRISPSSPREGATFPGVTGCLSLASSASAATRIRCTASSPRFSSRASHASTVLI